MSAEKEIALKWYLKGFYDAETSESQDVSIEQTMKDAETHFYLQYQPSEQTQTDRERKLYEALANLVFYENKQAMEDARIRAIKTIEECKPTTENHGGNERQGAENNPGS